MLNALMFRGASARTIPPKPGDCARSTSEICLSFASEPKSQPDMSDIAKVGVGLSLRLVLVTKWQQFLGRDANLWLLKAFIRSGNLSANARGVVPMWYLRKFLLKEPLFAAAGWPVGPEEERMGGTPMYSGLVGGTSCWVQASVQGRVTQVGSVTAKFRHSERSTNPRVPRFAALAICSAM